MSLRPTATSTPSSPSPTPSRPKTMLRYPSSRSCAAFLCATVCLDSFNHVLTCVYTMCIGCHAAIANPSLYQVLHVIRAEQFLLLQYAELDPMKHEHKINNNPGRTSAALHLSDYVCSNEHFKINTCRLTVSLAPKAGLDPAEADGGAPVCLPPPQGSRHSQLPAPSPSDRSLIGHINSGVLPHAYRGNLDKPAQATGDNRCADISYRSFPSGHARRGPGCGLEAATGPDIIVRSAVPPPLGHTLLNFSRIANTAAPLSSYSYGSAFGVHSSMAAGHDILYTDEPP